MKAMTEAQKPFNLYRFTRLGRTLSLRHESHRFALTGSIMAGAGGFVYWWLARDEVDLVGAFFVGVAVFLAWACARELDPDRNFTAGVALVLAAPMAVWGRPALLLVLIALQAMRLTVGTIGGTLKPADYVAIILAAGYAGTRPEGWVLVAFLVAGVAISQAPGYLFLAGGVMASGSLGAIITGASIPDQPGSNVGWVWQLVVVVALVVSLQVRGVSSTTDVGNQPISAMRLRVARALTGLMVVGALLSNTTDAVVVMGPVLAALVATVVVAAVSSGSVVPVGWGSDGREH